MTFTKKIANDWTESAYYDIVESQGALDLFWGRDSVFKSWFDTLDHDRIIEIACGHGRHVDQYKHLANEIVLVDVNEENIEFCRQRHAGESKIAYYRNSGSDLGELADESATSLFSYDAMVHFELTDVISYLGEFHRVLVPGARALIHHSNLASNPGGDPHWHPTWRNYMSCDLFTHIATRAGFSVLAQQTLPWGGFNNNDGVTLLRK